MALPIRTAVVGDLRLVATSVPARSELVRVHSGDDPHYGRMILVTQERGGRVLHLAGWIGEPLTPEQWESARDLLYPMADRVRFERLRGGEFVERWLRLPRSSVTSVSQLPRAIVGCILASLPLWTLIYFTARWSLG